MKKFILAASALALISCSSIIAQETTNKASKTTANTSKPIAIKSSIDSLSYAYGVNLVNQGLSQYIEQLGLFSDEATKMQDLTSFIDAMNEALTADKNEKIRIAGLTIGDQITKMAANLSKQTRTSELSLQLVTQAIGDVLSENPLQLDSSEVILQRKIEEANLHSEELKKEEYALQIETGQKFMEQNKLQEGVVSLPSGLQYKILTKGDGQIPTLSDHVKVHYKGTLLDGTEFDSSYKRGEPITLGLGQVITGWTEALQLMPVGSKWILYIPYNLAYGEREAGPIPPYSNLIFEIELLDIVSN